MSVAKRLEQHELGPATCGPNTVVCDTNALLTDTINLFERRVLGGMGIYAYINGGRPHLEALFNDPGYDGEREKYFIPTIADNFYTDLPDKITLVELGPGTAWKSKTAAFIEEFNKKSQAKGDAGKTIVEYVAVDVVRDYAVQATQGISQRFHITAGKPVVGDFTKTKESPRTLGTPVLISWNSPVWNAPRDPDMDIQFVYANSIDKAARLVPGGKIILTHYPFRDEERVESVEATYGNEHCSQAVLAIPALIQHKLNPRCTDVETGKDVDFSGIFDYSSRIDFHDDVVHMDLVVRRTTDVKFGDHYDKRLEAREPFTAVCSGKPSQRRFNTVVRKSGVVVDNTVANQQGNIVAQLLSCSPS